MFVVTFIEIMVKFAVLFAFTVLVVMGTISIEARSMLDNLPKTAPIDLTLYSENAISWYDTAKQICFPDLGCFTDDGAMKQTGILPNTPAEIGTKFYAYTPKAVHTEHLVDPYTATTFTPIDASKELVIIAHGFGNNHNTEQMQTIKDALLQYTHGEIGTVIVVDWAKGAREPFYNEASTNTQVVGRQIAHFVEELRTKHSVQPKNVYLIGFSLGAQVAGFAGKFSQTQYKWKFGRITGLDAAAPMFEDHEGSFLNSEDAEFVDAVHTSIGTNLLKGEIGFTKSYAHVDFYPNGGHNQPMCTSIFHIACNHYASVLFYTASITAKSTCSFQAYSCANWDTFKTGSCTNKQSELGYNAIKFGKVGNQFLKTTAKFPFCNV